MPVDPQELAVEPDCLLALESTCDETAAAIIRRDGEVLGSAIATQERLHEAFGGVVPEIAARAHLENFLPVLRATFSRSQVTPAALVAVAVATRPGLPGSLLVGLSTAKGLAIAWNKPLVSVDHLHAHIYACTIGRQTLVFPCVGLVVSGGHTHLYNCHGPVEWDLLGSTIDDAAGEAFDKVAVMLGLPFPGGPELSRLAAGGNRTAFAFPRPLLQNTQSLDFSFSGLKTAVRYAIADLTEGGRSPLASPQVMDVAASFEQAVVDCLVGKCRLAMRRANSPRLAVGGGVAANPRLRESLQQLADREQFELIIAEPSLCTDNAVMGAIAWEKVSRGLFDPIDLDITAGLVRSR